MPIPRKNGDEFFISGLNPLLIDNNDNQAVIYVPHEFHPRPNFTESFTIFLSNITLENRIFDNFRSDMMSIFSNNTININNRHSILVSSFIVAYSRLIFTDCLNLFLATTANDNNDLISLSYDFYIVISNNRRLRHFLSTNTFNNLIQSIYDYHEKLVKSKEEEEKEKKRNGKCFYKYFKEFKVHQSYVGKKYIKQIGEYQNCSNKNFVNQHKYRKLRYLKRAINI